MDNIFSNISINGGFGSLFKLLAPKKKKAGNLTDSEELEGFLDALNGAKQNLENAQQLFDSTSDPDLIEYAIYEEYAAKLKLSYLVKKAKEKNIKTPDFTAI